jgi:hypothetical protein
MALHVAGMNEAEFAALGSECKRRAIGELA